MSEETAKPQPWSKPRREVLDPPKPTGMTVSELPEHMLPEIPDASTLVKLGEVCGQEIWAPRRAVERAEHLRKSLGAEKNWPADALRATILALRMQKPQPTYREIAVMLNMSERHVLRAAQRGRKELVVEREVRRLDREGIPLAVENVLEGLEAKDKEYTLEFLKGRGVFSNKPGQGAGQAPGEQTPAAALVVQFIHNGEAPPLKPGAISASPNRALASAAAVIDVPTPDRVEVPNR